MRLQELFDLLLRWFHVIAGILWIGNSMLFNWLDRNLVRRPELESDPKYQGTIWMVHSGAFYEVEKKLLAPNQLPAELHWFKWQNGLTWLSGIFLLVVVYYLNDGAFLVDPMVASLSQARAIGIGLAVIVGSWVVYDLVWRTLGRASGLATAVTLLLLGTATWVLIETLSGRAAYIHAGVMIGTIMTGNVWMVILPSQRSLIAATRSGQEQDIALGIKAKQRSVHNNYLTFPLLFIMVSNHYPATWGHPRAWIVLLVVMAAGAGVRHGMNLRYSSTRWQAVVAGSLVGGVVALVGLTSTGPQAEDAGAPVPFATADAIIGQRCRPCHSARPTDPLAAAVNGLFLDTPEQIRGHAPRIRARVVELRNMPFLNRTEMTDEERETLRRWLDQGAKTAIGP